MHVHSSTRFVASCLRIFLGSQDYPQSIECCLLMPVQLYSAGATNREILFPLTHFMWTAKKAAPCYSTCTQPSTAKNSEQQVSISCISNSTHFNRTLWGISQVGTKRLYFQNLEFISAPDIFYITQTAMRFCYRKVFLYALCRIYILAFQTFILEF